MKTKNKINYWKLVKSSRVLVTNKNFRNNQNYIISDFSKFKFFNKYYRSWLSKKANKITIYIFTFMIFSSILFVSMIDVFGKEFVKWIFIYTYLFSWISILFLLFFIIYDRFIYYFYKKFSFIKRKHVFVSNRYIFLKNPSRSKYILNRRDFISFKK